MAGLLEEGEDRVRIDDYLDGNCNYHTNTLFFFIYFFFVVDIRTTTTPVHIGILLKLKYNSKISLVNLQPANYRTR